MAHAHPRRKTLIVNVPFVPDLVTLIFDIGTGGTNREGLQGDFDDSNVTLPCSDYSRVITTLWMFFGWHILWVLTN